MVDRLIRPLVDAVTQVADHALELWAGGRTQVERWEKTPGEMVCEADLQVNDMLRKALGQIDSGAGWLSEETADDLSRLGRDRIWIVDPIDGTRDYLAGRTGWAVSVALVEQSQPVIGILAAPARNELWIARAGQGALRNGQPLTASRRRRFTGARVPAEQLPQEDADLTMVARPNSIALRMAMVASDMADLVATFRWGNEWDVAASTLIAREAGACVTDAAGGHLIFNRPQPIAPGILCCAPDIHAQAIERLSDRAAQLLPRRP